MCRCGHSPFDRATAPQQRDVATVASLNVAAQTRMCGARTGSFLKQQKPLAQAQPYATIPPTPTPMPPAGVQAHPSRATHHTTAARLALRERLLETVALRLRLRVALRVALRLPVREGDGRE